MEPSTSKTPEKIPEEIPKEVEVKQEIKESAPVKQKRKKSRKIRRAEGFPKFFKNGYVRYCDEIRPIVCGENANMDPVEVTKLVAQKWYALSAEEKAPYLEEAKLDKERFKKELKEFEKKHPGEASLQVPPKKKSKGGDKTKSEQSNIQQKTVKISGDKPPVPKEDDAPKFVGNDCELPIFTERFLEHNKSIEAELKLLRKNNIEIEQQNSVLMKHIENMVNGVTKVESEILTNKQRNVQLEIYLTRLRCILAGSGFNSLALPSMHTTASVENIDQYIGEMASEATATSSPAIVNKAAEILRKLDLKIPV